MARSSKLAEDRALIREAMVYRSGEDSCNSVYMGSMAIAGLYHVLGLRYGEGNFAEALEKAGRKKVDALLKECKSMIVYMRAHPRKHCPCCGQIIKAA